MSSIKKKVFDDVLGFDKNRFLGVKKKNIKNAVGKVMTPGQIKEAGKIAKKVAPVVAITGGSKIANTLLKGVRGLSKVAKVPATAIASGFGKTAYGASKTMGTSVGRGLASAGISKLIRKKKK